MQHDTMIDKTLQYLQQTFTVGSYAQSHPQEAAYRLEHSCRVAHIGLQIAQAEQLNGQAMVLACLLHDIAYGNDLQTQQEQRDHGRTSARLTRAFLRQQGYDAALTEEICYGIAIHVDDEADFPGERTAFACTVGDADNIDRFDAYRIFENLKRIRYDELPLDEKCAYVTRVLGRLDELEKMELATKEAKTLWLEKLAFQRSFYQRLHAQLNNSTM